ncbi:Eisosome component PIL1-domain-containing protein [Infundibulicybe gibba]|nr:Eisosome component PIL1-domain-containing protein [Infundibulicybe gibba]
MPVPSFLATFADKAQSAIHQAAHSASGRPSSPDSSAQPTANETAAQGGRGSHALESIQYQIRAFGQQYASTTPVQKIITSEKGVAIDFDSAARDSKAQSKELYTWGQTEQEDLKDVTDRLAYLNFVQGSLASSLATKLDAARAPLKALRDAETALAPRRNVRAGLRNQLARIEHDQQKGMERRIAELKDQIRKADLDDQSQEKEVDLLKRKAVRESEQLKWEAIREYGEKLVLLSQAASPIIAALPTLPPTQANPYSGAQATGAARASLQRALDNYKTGHINLSPHTAGSDLSRSDTRSFGESHASELSSINSDTSTHHGAPVTPPIVSQPLPQAHTPSSPQRAPEKPASSPPMPHSPPINPSALNNSPAPLPPMASVGDVQRTESTGVSDADTSHPSTIHPIITPTVAETGVPVSAGAQGPGPASGSLHDIKAASPTAGPRSAGLPGNNPHASLYGQIGPGFAPTPAAAVVQQYESAEKEKKRLEDSQVLTNPRPVEQTPSGPPAAPYETAEQEKKRLEREERERILQTGGTSQGDGAGPKKDDDLPPSYQDY